LAPYSLFLKTISRTCEAGKRVLTAALIDESRVTRNMSFVWP
jgi:hypothetical protein